MASPKQQIVRLRNQISRARSNDSERVNDAVGAGSALLTGVGIGAMRGRYADDEGEWNIKGTKIPIELLIGIGGLGLSMSRVTGDGLANAGILSVGNSALAILAARKTEVSVRKKMLEDKEEAQEGG